MYRQPGGSPGLVAGFFSCSIPCLQGKPRPETPASAERIQGRAGQAVTAPIERLVSPFGARPP